MQRVLNIVLILTFLTTVGQEYTLIDFGSNLNATSLNWNNPIVNTSNQDGLNIRLVNFDGKFTGEMLTISDSFDLINDSGTTNPSNNLPFSTTATRDNYFGEMNPFNGNTNTNGAFTLSNLDVSKYYSFSVFASRMGVSDNRETLYTVIGQNTVTDILNPSNNTTETATILNVQPNNDGTIIFNATAGTNNNNSYGFYYLGAIKMVSSINSTTNINDSYLSLVYPNGNENWEVGKTISISWQSYNLTNDILIEYSSDNGNSWSTVVTVTADLKKYDWQVPAYISTDCLVRLTSGTKTDLSTANFSIIEDENISYKIVILGSSTSAGTGPHNINDAWVWRYKDYLTHLDTRFELINLAVGGFTTYNLLPTGTTIPSGVSHIVEINNNITKALSLNPDGIIINLPSNDAAFNYPSSDQIANYHLIRNTALAENIPVWISSPQPKNFGADATGLAIQLEMIPLTISEFSNFAYDFWSDFELPSNNGLKSKFDVDGTHMNAYGHHVLVERVLNKEIHIIIKNTVDSSLATENYNLTDNLNVYPNPFNTEINFNLSNKKIQSIDIYNIKGQLITNITNINSNNILKWNPTKLITKGIYYCKILTDTKLLTTKIILN